MNKDSRQRKLNASSRIPSNGPRKTNPTDRPIRKVQRPGILANSMKQISMRRMSSAGGVASLKAAGARKLSATFAGLRIQSAVSKRPPKRSKRKKRVIPNYLSQGSSYIRARTIDTENRLFFQSPKWTIDEDLIDMQKRKEDEAVRMANVRHNEMEAFFKEIGEHATTDDSTMTIAKLKAGMRILADRSGDGVFEEVKVLSVVSLDTGKRVCARACVCLRVVCNACANFARHTRCSVLSSGHSRK